MKKREARRLRGSVEQKEAGLKGEPETGGLAGDINKRPRKGATAAEPRAKVQRWARRSREVASWHGDTGAGGDESIEYGVSSIGDDSGWRVGTHRGS